MNDTIRDFFDKHNIDVKKLAYQKDSHIWNVEEIDNLVSNYGMDGNRQNGQISIADIIGYEVVGVNSPNLLYDLSGFFDRTGDGYHRRSCDLLDISSDVIMQRLERSFETEPIIVRHIHGNNNIIYTNGLHRYTVLRVHFLNECYGINKESKEYQALREKYTLPAKIVHVDLLKTYSNYLLTTNPKFKISVNRHYDSNFQPTNNVEVKFNDSEKQILNDEELIALTRETTLSISDDPYTIKRLKKAQENNQEFLRYMDTYIPELSLKQTKENIGGAKLC